MLLFLPLEGIERLGRLYDMLDSLLELFRFAKRFIQFEKGFRRPWRSACELDLKFDHGSIAFIPVYCGLNRRKTYDAAVEDLP